MIYKALNYGFYFIFFTVLDKLIKINNALSFHHLPTATVPQFVN